MMIGTFIIKIGGDSRSVTPSGWLASDSWVVPVLGNLEIRNSVKDVTEFRNGFRKFVPLFGAGVVQNVE